MTRIEKIKALLGEANSYTDGQIEICLDMAEEEVAAYCGVATTANLGIDYCIYRIAIIKLGRIGNDGLDSESFGGVSQSYIDGYPEDIIAILNRKRKLKTL